MRSRTSLKLGKNIPTDDVRPSPRNRRNTRDRAELPLQNWRKRILFEIAPFCCSRRDSSFFRARAEIAPFCCSRRDSSFFRAPAEIAPFCCSRPDSAFILSAVDVTFYINFICIRTTFVFDIKQTPRANVSSVILIILAIFPYFRTN